MKTGLRIVALLLATQLGAQIPPAQKSPLRWMGWSTEVFAQARRGHKLVLLDLEAVWCHWCHVMDETTYKDPEVIRLLQSKYILVKVDQDSRPDLSNRYEDFGWPATIVFAADGSEIVKRRGYLPPDQMASILQAIIDDPSPGPSVEAEPKLEYPANSVLAAKLREELRQEFLEGFDKAHGSWGFDQKYLDWDSVEYSLDLAKTGDKNAEHMARETLHAQLHLLDPAWGGVYQYSTDGDWNAPHFEKLIQFQAENLRIYSLGSAQFGDPEYRHAADEIHRYVRTFLLSPEGAFFTSQDADLIEGKHSADYFSLSDRERRKLGVPRIDKQIYSRENGWMIAALATFYGARGETQALEEARRAAEWIIRNRAIPGGGFRHGQKDPAGPYLGDTLAMGRAFLALYSVTGERPYLMHAREAADFIEHKFKSENEPGYVTSGNPMVQGYAPHAERDENVQLLRFANLLGHYTGEVQYRRIAENAMRYLGAATIAKRAPAASVLLADREWNSPPLHLTVVGKKDDPQAEALYKEAQRYPSSYKRLEWWDAREGRLLNHDVEYPQFQSAAIFVCTDRTCSAPIFDPQKLRGVVDRITEPSVQRNGERKSAAPPSSWKAVVTSSWPTSAGER